MMENVNTNRDSTSLKLLKRSVLAVVADIALIFCSLANAEILSETSKDVGFGFREVQRSETMGPGSWEGAGHFALLFYKDQELSQYDSHSIAPSGKYALFQDGPTGEIQIFTRATAQRRKVSKFPGSLAKQYIWREDRMEATIVFADASSLRVLLRRP
jgi:hypothetical protein